MFISPLCFEASVRGCVWYLGWTSERALYAWYFRSLWHELLERTVLFIPWWTLVVDPCGGPYDIHRYTAVCITPVLLPAIPLPDRRFSAGGSHVFAQYVRGYKLCLWTY